ncbi:MAG TPA: sulfotransferase [Sphingomicrobium sp.]|nr:sulfotransferase [Sphingomicrobium sp.]
MPRIADFEKFAFIVGAPRCGTTTMSRLLQAHPQVAFPFVKEPHFFSLHDLRGLSEAKLRERVEDDYLGHFFKPLKAGQSVGADGSVSYLYTPEQMEPVLKLWPESRFVIGVRDPMTLLPSLHQRLIYIGDETLTRFADAWAAVPDRAEGKRIPRSCADPRWLRYDEAGRFGTYVERLFAAVGRERCLVVVFDDLVSDPAHEFRRILDFLGLDQIDPAKIQAERESRGVRYHWLQRLLKRPPKALHSLFAGAEYRRRFANGDGDEPSNGAAADKVLSLRKRLLRWNSTEHRDEPVPVHVQQEIRAHLNDEIGRLGELIGRDLGHWLQPRG